MIHTKTSYDFEELLEWAGKLVPTLHAVNPDLKPPIERILLEEDGQVTLELEFEEISW